VEAFIGMGANLGDAPATLAWAARALADLPASRVSAVSSLYRSAPRDCPPGCPDFFNAVVCVHTALTAPDLLAALLALERLAGRQRPYKNAPRTLDLDLLLYGQACIDSDTLTVPHPRMDQRAFVLLPLAEIAPDRVGAAPLSAVADQVIARSGPLASVRSL
jgi:2-amino-4-hydroxy-6-hydroxymethyldihydropteridine diphosphokinase